jgi:hypothetical protein
MSWGKVPKLFASGGRAYVVGGGPSAADVDWEKLRGKAVVACNAAGFLLPEGIVKATVVVDKRFMNLFRPRLLAMDSPVFYAPTPGRPVDEKNGYAVHLKRLQSRKYWGISEDPGVVRYNRGCGGTAINIAYLMGARELILIGFDCSIRHGFNWHREYTDLMKADRLVTPGSEYYVGVSLAMEKVREDLERLGVLVWNTVKGTPFSYWPLEDLL